MIHSSKFAYLYKGEYLRSQDIKNITGKQGFDKKNKITLDDYSKYLVEKGITKDSKILF